MPGPLAETHAPWKVEVDFANGPTSTSYAWTDITAYVLSWSTKRGRQYELSRSETGTLSLLLENADGRFDPTNATGPYATTLLPMRRVRVTATHAGTTSGLFFGFIERWPQEWDGSLGTYGTVSVTAVDGFRALAAVEFGDAWDAQVEASAPWLWDRLDNAGGVQAVQPDDTTVSTALSTAGGTGVAATSLVLGNRNEARTYDLRPGGVTASRVLRGIVSNQSSRIYGAFSFSVLFRVDAGNSGAAGSLYARLFATGSGGGTPSGMYVRANPGTGAFEVVGMDSAGTAYIVATGTTLYSTALYTMTWDGSAYRWYVNGVLAVGPVASAAGPIEPEVGGNPSGLAVIAYTLDEWIIHLRALSATAIKNLASTSTNAASTFREFGAANTGQRVHDVLNAIGWPAAQRVIYTGAMTLQGSGDVGGQTALQVIQNAEAAELGAFFMDGLGRAVFLERNRQQNATAVGTFGDQLPEVAYNPDVSFDFDDTNLVNEVTITQEGITPPVVVTASDTTSQGRYFRRTFTLSAPYTTEQQAADTAAEILRRYKDPHLRCPSLTIDPGTDDGAFLPALRWELGDKVLVRRRPRKAPQVTLTATVEGIAHDVDTAGRWLTTFQLSPVV